MYPKISSRTALVALLCVLTFFLSAVNGQEPKGEPKYKPRYLLRTFTATGADSNDFDINDYDAPDNNDHDPDSHPSIIYIRNVKNKKKVWVQRVGGTGSLGFELRIGPDKKHGLLDFGYGTKGQSLFWIHLPQGKPPAMKIDLGEFEKLALKACGNVNPDHVDRHIYDFWFDFLDWDAQGRCRLKWQCEFKHRDDNYHTNTGIAIVTVGSDGKPSLSLDSFLTDVEDMNKVKYGKHATLKE